MRILHIIPNLLKGGAERICLDICQELSKRKEHKVKLVLLDGSNEYPFLTKGLDIEIIDDHVKYSLTKKNIYSTNQLDRILKTFQPDVIHSHLYASEIVVKHSNHKGTPVFFHVHDNIIQFSKKNKLFSLNKSRITMGYERKQYFRKLKDSPTKFLCISNDALNFIKNNVPTADCVFFPNAINFNRFKFESRKYSPDLNLISIGSLVAKKGHSFLIDVVNILKSIHKKENVKLTILGDGPLREELQKKITHLKLEENIILKGKVNYPEKFLNDSTLYIHGASYEPFGLVLIEAMASGLPVISTNGKGNKDIVISGENGFMISSRDSSMMASKIIETIENKELYHKLSEGAISFSKKYDIQPYCDKLVSLYSSMFFL